MLFSRALQLPETPTKSFFLWGPRQAGKSSLLRNCYRDSPRIDLLLSDQFLFFTESPARLRARVRAKPDALWVLDEVQKIPPLLDEVHWLIEELGTRFVLCGSSARKLKQGGGNLLGGRARRFELFGCTSFELGNEFDLTKFINIGNIPSHYLSDDPKSDLEAYVGDYIKEEISAEALVRNLPRFIDFLRAAAICDTEVVDFTKVASECGVKSATARNHYAILEDTLMGFFLPAYVKRQKRRIIYSPKFYFANVGVVNELARRRNLEPGSELFGKAFENFLVNEIRAVNEYQKKRWDLSYWRLASGGEVDLLLNDAEHAFEFKSSGRVTTAHLKGLREIHEDFPNIKSRNFVYLGSHRERTEDGIDVLPLREFLDALWGDVW